MALTNSQYEQIMHTYEQHRLENEYRRRRRYADIEIKIPQRKELDNEISSLSLQQARRLLEGDESALDTLKKKIHALSQKKACTSSGKRLSFGLSGASLHMPGLPGHGVYRRQEMPLL